MLLALGLRLPSLGQSIWFDEACMSHQRVGSFEQLIATLYVDIHPPLFLGFMHFWGMLVGDGEIVMRLPALACGLASIPLIYLIALRLLNGPIAMGAALAACLSPVHLWYSVEARLYAPNMFLALLAIWLFHRILDSAKGRNTLWLVLVMLVMVGVHYYLAVFLVAFFLISLFASRLGSTRKTGLTMMIWSGSICVAILAFVAVKMSMAEFETSQGYMVELSPVEAYRLFFQWCLTGNASAGGLGIDGGPSAATGSLGWLFWTALQAVGVVLFALGVKRIASMAKQRPEAACVFVYLACMPLFLALLPLIGFTGTYIQRSALPALPFFFMVLAAGWDSIGAGQARRVLAVSCVALLGINLAVFFARPEAWTVYKPHQDWRSAAAYLGAEIDAGTAAPSMFTGMPNQRSLSYYDVRIQTHANLLPSSGKLSGAKKSFERRLGANLGGMVGDYAEHVTDTVEATKAELMAGSKVLLYPIRKGTLASLDSTALGASDSFYVLFNHWHPPEDPRSLRLVSAPGVTLIEQRDFRGITIFKLRLVP
ncbi:MAG: hypothetical protein ACI9D0_001433 [Bacteroidia bacterium]|jgi:hypothetical protein